ncbi:hypothetical protein TURU_152678 [Turdus rufiventris]|nr:hypothetical protein TURU_152678 [Turdus rufiventris]
MAVTSQQIETSQLEPEIAMATSSKTVVYNKGFSDCRDQGCVDVTAQGVPGMDFLPIPPQQSGTEEEFPAGCAPSIPPPPPAETGWPWIHPTIRNSTRISRSWKAKVPTRGVLEQK